ncbi:MAG: DUF3667 domain-containing protein [Pedobacter sp.]|nr:MAG: DUF3667 domain-containing protein [Pedobacter sp.]
MPRFTLTHFFHEVFHAFTHADKGIFYLLKELLLRPGIVAREYIAGKRKKYFNPFTFFLILAAFYVLSESFKVSVNHVNKGVPTEITRIENLQDRNDATAIYNRAIKTQLFFTKHGNVIAMIAVPFFAFYFWVLFYRRKYNFSEHLVANLMFVSFANLAFSLLVFPLQALLKDTPYTQSVLFLGFLIQIIYFSMAYRGFLELKGFWPTFKVTMATIIGLMLWGFLTQLLSAIYVYQNLNFMEYFKHMFGR